MAKQKSFRVISRRQQNRRLQQMQKSGYFMQENIFKLIRHVKAKESNIKSNNITQSTVEKLLIQEDLLAQAAVYNSIVEVNTNIVDKSIIIDIPICNVFQNDASCYAEDISLREKLSLWAVEYKVQHKSLTSLLKILRNEGYDLSNDGRTLLKTPRCTQIYHKSGGDYYHYGLKNGIIDILSQCNNLMLQNPIVINVNVDGLPISKSSKSQLWPILIQIVIEGPPIIFIAGIFHGYNKSTTDDFLQQFITEYKQLNTTGIIFQNKIYEVKIRAIICDSPARSFVTYTKGHNGYFGCSKCTIEGDYINHRMLFLDNNCPLRTDEMFRQRFTPEHHTGMSLFEQIPLPMVTTFPLYYMHLICLGQMKKLLKLWLQGPTCMKA